MLLARLCEGSSLQLRSQGRSIAIWPSPKVGGLHDKSKDPYVGADWGLGSMVSPEHVACSSSWLFAELLMEPGRWRGGDDGESCGAFQPQESPGAVPLRSWAAVATARDRDWPGPFAQRCPRARLGD